MILTVLDWTGGHRHVFLCRPNSQVCPWVSRYLPNKRWTNRLLSIDQVCCWPPWDLTTLIPIWSPINGRKTSQLSLSRPPTAPNYSSSLFCQPPLTGSHFVCSPKLFDVLWTKTLWNKYHEWTESKNIIEAMHCEIIKDHNRRSVQNDLFQTSVFTCVLQRPRPAQCSQLAPSLLASSYQPTSRLVMLNQPTSCCCCP